jgi:hypothetical protein
MSDQTYGEMERWFATAESDAARMARYAGQTQFFPVHGTQLQALYRTSGQQIEITIQNRQGKIFGRATMRRDHWEMRPQSDQNAEFVWACEQSKICT